MLRDSGDLRGLLQYRLKKKGWNYEQLSEVTGIKSDRFSKYFRGVKPNLTQYEFIRAAKALGVIIDYDVRIID